MVRNKHNTPGIIKHPFWRMTYQDPKAMYACINYGDAAAPKETVEQKRKYRIRVSGALQAPSGAGISTG